MRRLKQLVMALILLLVQLLGVAFAAQNGTRVDVDLLLVQLPSTRLATLVLIAFVAGGLAGLGSSSLALARMGLDRKSTRLNSSHVAISYAVFCLKKKNNKSPLRHERTEDK